MRVTLILSAILCAGMSTLPAQAQQAEEAEIIDLRETTCRMLLTFDGTEEEQVLIFFHGFMSGTQNNPMVDIAAFSEASAEITDTCIDNPEMTLLDAFKVHR